MVTINRCQNLYPTWTHRCPERLTAPLTPTHHTYYLYQQIRTFSQIYSRRTKKQTQRRLSNSPFQDQLTKDSFVFSRALRKLTLMMEIFFHFKSLSISVMVLVRICRAVILIGKFCRRLQEKFSMPLDQDRSHMNLLFLTKM